MSRSSALVLFGIVTVLSPLSGLPIAFRTLITIACGVAVLSIGLIMRTRDAVSAASTKSDVPREAPPTGAPEMSPI